MTVEELQVIITANTNDLRNELAKTQNSLASLEKTGSKTSSGVLKGFKFLKTGIVALGIGKLISTIMGGLGNAMARVDTLNNYPRIMGNLGVATEDANASLDRLSEKLVGLPTTMDDAVSSVQRFTSSNNNVKASTEMFLALNNAILAGGAPIDQQRSALEQLSQAYAKGKPDMMEWRTAMSAMPAQMKQTAQAMGYVSADALGEALRSGEVSMNEFMTTLMKLNKEGANGFQSFEDQAKNSTGGIGTSITNVRTAITRGLADIMNAIGQSNIAGFFQGIAKAINTVIPYIVAFVKVVVMAVSWVSSLFGGGKTSADSMTSAVDKTASSVSNLGGSASDTSSDMDKTTGSAKKLKKELLGLASFDEMNVLKEPESDSGSGSGSGGASAGGLDLSGMDFDWDTQATGVDKVSQHVQSMLGFFKQLADIGKNVWDSTPVQAYVGVLTSGFNAVKNFATELGTALWENLGMTWSNISANVGLSITNILTLMTNYWNDLSEGIDTFAPIITEKFVGLFNDIWATAIDPFVVLVSQVWADFTGILVSLWDKHGKTLITNVGEFVTGMIDLFQSIYDNILEPIITPLLETMSWLWDKHIKGMIETVGDFIGKLVNGALEIWNKFLNPIIQWVMTALAPVWSYLSSLVIGVVGSILGVLSDLLSGVFRFLGGIIDFITGIFTGNWSKAWQGVVDIAGSIIDGIVAVIKFPINLIIDGINAFIRGLNKIKIPDWVPVVGGKGLNIATIPKLATGGIIDKPTLAVVGEQGKEAVMPLENNTGWITQLAKKIDAVGNNKGGSDKPIYITVKVGEETLVDKVIDGANRKAFEQNEEVFVL